MRAELFALSDITHIPASEQAFTIFTVLMNRFMWTLMLCHKTFQSRRQILANITHLSCVRCSVESFTYIISFNLPHATSLSLSCIGEGNGNPFQCSCLENPRDRGAWWAAVYGVAQSQTLLKRLSSMLL